MHQTKASTYEFGFKHIVSPHVRNFVIAQAIAHVTPNGTLAYK